jgi:MoaA/NifB/PqqE/SkfB family radical SAM enzyme
LVKRALFKTKFSACIDATDRCNLSCPHCYHKNSINENGGGIALAEWERRFSEYYKKGVRVVFLTGGEPSLRLDVIELAAKVFPYVTVYTNGQVKIPPRIRCKIYLSLDGLESEHDALRGEGVFARAVANYKNDNRVIVYSLLSSSVYKGKSRLAEFIDYVNTMNVQGLKFDFFVPQTDSPESYGYVLPDDVLPEIGEVIAEKKKQIGLNIIFDHNIYKRQIQKGRDVFGCTMQTANYVIAANGNLKRCVDNCNDCRFCRTDRSLNIPFWQLRDWRVLKKIRRQYF